MERIVSLIPRLRPSAEKPVIEENPLLKGDDLRRACEGFYTEYVYENFEDYQMRKEDPRYPRANTKEIFKLLGTGLVVVEATRDLRTLHCGYGEYMERVEEIVSKRKEGIYKNDVALRSQNILRRTPIGNMDSIYSFGELGHPFGPNPGQIPIKTDPELFVKKGTYGLIHDYYKYRRSFCVFWQGFSKENPGRYAIIPDVSFHPGREYDLKILPDALPGGWWVSLRQLPDLLSVRKEDVDPLASLIALIARHSRKIPWTLDKHALRSLQTLESSLMQRNVTSA